MKPPRIALTRPFGENKPLKKLLSAHAIPIELPLIGFVEYPFCDPSHWSSYTGWVILSSPQGAKSYLRHDFRHDHIATVGSATAQPLFDVGLNPFVPSVATARVLAAELPDHHMNVLHFTSDISSDTLKKGLIARGFSYERAVLYRTQARDLPKAEQSLLDTIDAFALASGSAAASLARYGTQYRIATMGEQTTNTAQSLGFSRIIQADLPHLDSLAKAALIAARH